MPGSQSTRAPEQTTKKRRQARPSKSLVGDFLSQPKGQVLSITEIVEAHFAGGVPDSQLGKMLVERRSRR